MQAVVIAAGAGRRLADVTEGEPKCLLRVGGQRLLDRQLDQLRDAGVSEAVIVVGYRRDAVAAAVGDRPGVRLVDNPDYAHTNTLASFWAGFGLVRADFVFLHADVIFEPALLARLLDARGSIVLPVDRHPCDEEAMKVRVRDGALTRIGKDIDPPEAYGESMGIALVREAAFPMIRRHGADLLRLCPETASFESVLQGIVDEGGGGRIVPLDVTDLRWEEIDFRADYLRAERLFHPGA